MRYLLLDNAFSKKDLKIGSQVLKSGKITMSFKTIFLKKISQKNKFKIFCGNSGSSANLLSVAVACNPMKKTFEPKR